MASNSEEKLRWVLPLWPYPSFEVSTVALRLGCRTAEIAATSDTFSSLP
jgi:hypothetical protein